MFDYDESLARGLDFAINPTSRDLVTNMLSCFGLCEIDIWMCTVKNHTCTKCNSDRSISIDGKLGFAAQACGYELGNLRHYKEVGVQVPSACCVSARSDIMFAYE